MAVNNWIGGTTAVAQVDHLTPGGTIEAGDKFIVTMTDEDLTTETITYSASGTTVQSVVEGLQALLAATSGGGSIFATVTWTEDNAKIIGTANTAGVPFYCSVSTTESNDAAADDQTFARTSSVANAGPNDWGTAANWSTGVLPADGDAVWIRDSLNAILYGMNQASIDPASLHVTNSMQANVGRIGYPLRIGTTELHIGEQSATNVAPPWTLVNIYVGGATQSTLYVWNTGASGPSIYQRPCMIQTGAQGFVKAYVYGGTVGLGLGDASETCKLSTVEVLGGDVAFGTGCNIVSGYFTAGTVTCMAGTIGGLHIAGGTVTIATPAAVGSIVVIGGTTIVQQIGSVTNDHVQTGGTVTAYCSYNVSGVANLFSGTLDLTGTRLGHTVVGLVTIWSGATLNYRPAEVDFTAGIAIGKNSTEDVQIAVS